MSVVMEGMEDLESLLRRLAEQLGYITLAQRARGSAPDEPLGRFNWRDEDLQVLVVDQDDWPWGADGAYVREPCPTDYVTGSLAWVRATAERNCTGEPLAKFRIRLYQPKGGYITSCQVAIRRPHLEDLGEHGAAATPAFEAAADHGAVALLKSLQALLSDAVQITSTGYSRLADQQNKALARAASQLDKQEERYLELAQRLTEFNTVAITTAANADEAERKSERRHRLAASALDRIGSIGELVLAKEAGVDPRLAPLAEILRSQPELAEALADPDLQALLKDPETARTLAQFLTAAANDERAKRAEPPPTQPTPEPPPPTDPPTPSDAADQVA